MTKILLTAFEPFGGETKNVSQEAAARVPETVAGVRIVKCLLPVVFGTAGETLRAAIEREAPDAVLCVGQAAGRTHVTPERVAINLRDARIADNAGAMPVDEPIVPGGPAAYFSNLPVRAMVERMGQIPSALSYSAGTFVCNDVMYTLLHLIDRRYRQMRGGFVHIPAQMPPETAAQALEQCLAAVAALYA